MQITLQLRVSHASAAVQLRLRHLSLNIFVVVFSCDPNIYIRVVLQTQTLAQKYFSLSAVLQLRFKHEVLTFWGLLHTAGYCAY